MAKIKYCVGEYTEKLDDSSISGEKCKIKIEQSQWNTIWKFLIKSNMYLPYNSATALWVFISEKKHVHTKICIYIFIAASFVIVKN